MQNAFVLVILIVVMASAECCGSSFTMPTRS